jgi:hypothetical protein
MAKFIKLSNRIINTNFIKYINIDKENQKISLILATNSYGGFTFFGNGIFRSNADEVYATKKDHPESYNTIEKWILNTKCQSEN